jgi:hypothetical protein
MIEREYADQTHQLTQELQQAEVEINRLMIGPESSELIRRKKRALEELKTRAAPVYFAKIVQNIIIRC